MSWQALKKAAMADGYRSTVEYERLTSWEKGTVDKLIEAQKNQGDMNALRIKTPELGEGGEGFVREVGKINDGEMNKT